MLLETRLKPTVEINEEAEQVHGISINDLQDSPEFPVIYEQLKSILMEKPVVIFNADFDIRMIKQTAAAFDLNSIWLNQINEICAMGLSARAFGATNRYGSISLSNAVRSAGKSFSGVAHGAKVDVIATLDVLEEIHGNYKRLKAELEQLQK